MKLPRCTCLVSVLKYFGQLSVRWLIPGKTRSSRTAMDRLRLGLVNWTNYTAKYSYSKQLVLRSNLNHYRRLANNITKCENIFFVRSLIRKISWNFSNVARRQVFFLMEFCVAHSISNCFTIEGTRESSKIKIKITTFFLFWGKKKF